MAQTNAWIGTKLLPETTANRNWLTPYEILHAVRPSIQHCMPWYTTTHVVVPKEKRTKLKKKGLPFLRAETGRLVGYLDIWSNTPKVLLSSNRSVHSVPS